MNGVMFSLRASLFHAALLLSVLPAPPALAEDTASLDVAAIAQQAGAAVVRLGVFRGEDEVGNGTGFFIRQDGIVVTNHHVVDGIQGEMYAFLRDGRKIQALGILALDEEHDLAILKVDGTGFPVLELADPSTFKVGQPIVLIGSSKGFDQSVGVGIVSAIRTDGYPEQIKKLMEKAGESKKLGPLIQHTATAAPGASGSPLVDFSGRVVSVHHSSWGGGSEINFSAHADAVRTLMTKTDLDALPAQLGPNRLKNLAISAAIFSSIALAVVIASRLSRRKPKKYGVN